MEACFTPPHVTFSPALLYPHGAVSSAAAVNTPQLCAGCGAAAVVEAVESDAVVHGLLCVHCGRVEEDEGAACESAYHWAGNNVAVIETASVHVEEGDGVGGRVRDARRFKRSRSVKVAALCV